MIKPTFMINKIVVDKINWQDLPSTSRLLEQNMDMDWRELSKHTNPSHLLLKLDTNVMRKNCQPFAEELAAYVFHPLRLENMASAYGYELDEYMDYVM